MNAARGAATASLALLLMATLSARADVTIDFEPAGYTPGESVHNHKPDGTEAGPPPIDFGNLSEQAWLIPQRNDADATNDPDEEVVDLSGSADPEDAARGKVWRLSRAKALGPVGAVPQTPHMGETAGELGASNDAGRATATTTSFYAQFEFKSVTGAPQTDLAFGVHTASLDRRQNFIRIVDDGANGFDIRFVEFVVDAFTDTTFDLDLPYDEWHTVAIEAEFVAGMASGTRGDVGTAVGNDIVRLYVNGALIYTGTSWESIYSETTPWGVDQLLFAGTLNNFNTDVPSQQGNGMYFDNFFIGEQAPDADLSVTKSHDAIEPVQPGDQFDFTITVSNAGPGQADDVVALDDLPDSVDFISTSGCAEDPNGVPDCTLGTIPAGGEASYTITVEYNGTEPIVNTVSAAAATADPDDSNNSDTIRVGANPSPIPALSAWGLALLAGLLGLFAWRRRYA